MNAMNAMETLTFPRWFVWVLALWPGFVALFMFYLGRYLQWKWMRVGFKYIAQQTRRETANLFEADAKETLHQVAEVTEKAIIRTRPTLLPFFDPRDLP